MFFVLSKVTGFLLMPLSWVLGCWVLSYWAKNKKRKKTLRLSGLLMLMFFTNPGISNFVMRTWEIAPVEIASMPDSATVGIVLTGVTNPRQEPADRTHFNKGADRLLHAVQLYHAGKIKNILITGGSGSLIHQEVSESKGLDRVALMAGVHRAHLFIESESRNTRENALFSSRIINERWPNTQPVLITSAFHMRRSLGCFEKVGYRPLPFTADFYSVPWDWKDTAGYLIPSSDSLTTWNILIREWIGIISYRVVGYI